MVPGVQVIGSVPSEYAQVLLPEALAFVAVLHRQFNDRRLTLLEQRAKRQAAFDAGALPDFLPETAEVRGGDWQVASTPSDLQKGCVEITGPVERKMMINALNSGASVFMADFEDALSPTWDNVVLGQANLIDAVRRRITFTSPDGKEYRLNDQTAVLLVRPRGWHLTERHVLVDGEPISASLFDFGLYLYHNAYELLRRGSGPYLYLPKLESHVEARLWNDVFNAAQDDLGMSRGTIRATVLIETILAAFEMEEILFELREHASGLNAGRWDYMFSCIKKFRTRADSILPDRAQVTMAVPFMRAYYQLLVKTCHRRGAHAIGGMAAYIPSRKDAEVNERALAAVRADKERETGDGFDGTWVAHPDLVPIAWEIFKQTLGERDHQKEHPAEPVEVTAAQLLDFQVAGGAITETGFRNNVSVALQYLNAWLQGNGAAAIYNLMEDTATAEIARSQMWQWRHTGARLADGRAVTAERYQQWRDEELAKLGGALSGRLGDAAAIVDELVLSDRFIEFLTYLAYPALD